MRFIFPANSGNKLGSTYFLSPQIRRLRQSPASCFWLNKLLNRFCLSAALSLTVSIVWKGSAIRAREPLFYRLCIFLPNRVLSCLLYVLIICQSSCKDTFFTSKTGALFALPHDYSFCFAIYLFIFQKFRSYL